MKIKTLLITGIGGDIAQSTADIIRKKKPNIKLIGTDMQVRHAGSLFVDVCVNTLKAGDKNYLDVIKKLIDKYKIDAILPMSEAELTVYANIDNKINDCHVIHCGKEALKVGLDKLKTNQLLQSIGEPYPWTIATTHGSPIELPCILKPKTGSGSKGIFIIKDKVDVAYFNKKYPDSIYQELLTPNDEEITCAVYRTKTGEVFVLQMLRQLIGGATGWAIVVNHQKINKLCVKIANELDVFGSINIQLINTKQGAYIFEINPRISSTVAMRDSIGFEDVIWRINELEEKAIIPCDIQTNKVMYKICHVTLKSKN